MEARERKKSKIQTVDKKNRGKGFENGFVPQSNFRLLTFPISNPTNWNIPPTARKKIDYFHVRVSTNSHNNGESASKVGDICSTNSNFSKMYFIYISIHNVYK